MTDVALESPLRWLGGLIDIKVEAEADTPGDWVDITEYVERVTTRTGQERWGSRFAAGSCQLTLDNTAGYFTPAAGTSLSDLTWRPGLTIRIRALPDPEDPDVSHSLFTGRVQSSTDSYDAATGDVTTEVRLLDVLADLHQFNPPALDTPIPTSLLTSERVHAALNRYGFPPSRRLVQGGAHTMVSSALAQSTLEECQRAADAEGGALFADPDNNVVFRHRDWLVGGGHDGDSNMGLYETKVLQTGPIAFWRFSGPGATIFDSSGNSQHLTHIPTGTPPDVQQPGVDATDQAIRIPPTTHYEPADPAAFPTRDDEFTVEAWVLFPSTPTTAPADIIRHTDDNEGWRFEYHFSNGGRVTLTPMGATGAAASGTGIADDAWHHVVGIIDWPDSSTIRCRVYVDSVLAATGTAAASPVSPSGPPTIVVADGNLNPQGFLSELAIYDRALTVDEIEALFTARETTDLNSRSVNVQAQIGFPDGPPVVDARVSWDVARVRNHITFARTGGTVQVAEDAASQAAYGPRTYQRLDLQNNSNTAVLLLAQRALAAWKDDRIRVDQVTVAARAGDPSFHRLFYDAQLGDLVSVRINPRPGFTYDVDTHIVGIAHSITPSDWTVTLSLDDSLVAQEP